MKKNKPPKIKKQIPFPSREEVIAYIKESAGPVGKREIARAFRIHDDQRIQLKRLLQDLKLSGVAEKKHGRKIGAPGTLRDMAALEIIGFDDEGYKVKLVEAPPPGTRPVVTLKISPHQAKTLRLESLGKGDRVLCRLEHHGNNQYTARPMKRLAKAAAKLVGVIEDSAHGFIMRPTDRKNRDEFILDAEQAIDVNIGDIVTAETLPHTRLGKKIVKILENLGPLNAPRAVSLIAIAHHGIPWAFPDNVVEASEKLVAADVKGREDLRSIPLITIDGADARDFDDAVHAKAGANGSWDLIVAIADVSHYVKPNSIIDREAYKRGNSVYFPDRVVPMLPEALSNELCSLKPAVDRACMVAHMTINANGELTKFKFTRALMKSAARMTYEQVQEAEDKKSHALYDTVIKPLYDAYAVLLAARKKRGTLELDIAERMIKVGADGKISSIGSRERLESHKLIEEFMVLANVAAASALLDGGMAGLYRIHDTPSPEKLSNLRDFLKGFGVNLKPSKDLRPADLAYILEKFVGSEHSQVINEVMLRSQAQAVYSPENIGHFGLALARYAHFTSPIRRYADLIVHRALIRLFKLGDDGLTDDEMARLDEIGEHISKTERRAIEAERDASDRYTSLYLAEKIGSEFTGRISGVTKAGLFVRLQETGADGFVPMNALPNDYYNHDEANQRLVGSKNGASFRLADIITVKLLEADPVVGGLRFSIAGVEGRPDRDKSLPRQTFRADKGKHPFSGKRSFGKGKRR